MTKRRDDENIKHPVPAPCPTPQHSVSARALLTSASDSSGKHFKSQHLSLFLSGEITTLDAKATDLNV